MKSLLLLFLVLFQINVFSQKNSESCILDCIFGVPEIKNDTVFNKRGKIEKIIKPKIEELVINNYTNKISYSIESLEALISNGLTKLDSSIYMDFKARNTKSYRIDSLIIRNRKVVLIDTLESKRTIESGDWSSLLKKFPDSNLIISISKIGFNPSKTLALFYSTNENFLSGRYGFYTLFEFVNGEWKIKQSTMIFL